MIARREKPINLHTNGQVIGDLKTIQGKLLTTFSLSVNDGACWQLSILLISSLDANVIRDRI